MYGLTVWMTVPINRDFEFIFLYFEHRVRPAFFQQVANLNVKCH